MKFISFNYFANTCYLLLIINLLFLLYTWSHGSSLSLSLYLIITSINFFTNMNFNFRLLSSLSHDASGATSPQGRSLPTSSSPSRASPSDTLCSARTARICARALRLGAGYANCALCSPDNATPVDGRARVCAYPLYHVFGLVATGDGLRVNVIRDTYSFV